MDHILQLRSLEKKVVRLLCMSLPRGLYKYCEIWIWSPLKIFISSLVFWFWWNFANLLEIDHSLYLGLMTFFGTRFLFHNQFMYLHDIISHFTIGVQMSHDMCLQINKVSSKLVPRDQSPYFSKWAFKIKQLHS